MGNKLSVRRVMVQTLDEFGNPEGEPTYGVMAADDFAQAYNDTFDTFEDLRKAIVESGNILSLIDNDAFEDYGNIGMANFYGSFDDAEQTEGVFQTQAENLLNRIFDTFATDTDSEEAKELSQAMSDFTEKLVREDNQNDIDGKPEHILGSSQEEELVIVPVHLQADVMAHIHVPASLDASQRRILAQNFAMLAFSVTTHMSEEVSEYGWQETQKAAADVTKQHWYNSKIGEYQHTWNPVEATPPSTHDAKFLLAVETDYDFGVRFRGWDYISHEFTIGINDVSELDELKILGPFGAPVVDDTKLSEFLTAIEAIKKNPHERFSNLGGNRGVEWTPISKE